MLSNEKEYTVKLNFEDVISELRVFLIKGSGRWQFFLGPLAQNMSTIFILKVSLNDSTKKCSIQLPILNGSSF